MYSQSYPGRKKMIRCRPGRRSQPGHVTVPPLGEWKALRRGQTNHRYPNHEEAGPLEGKDGLLLSGQVWSTPLPGGWREQRRRRRRRKQPLTRFATAKFSDENQIDFTGTLRSASVTCHNQTALGGHRTHRSTTCKQLEVFSVTGAHSKAE